MSPFIFFPLMDSFFFDLSWSQCYFFSFQEVRILFWPSWIRFFPGVVAWAIFFLLSLQRFEIVFRAMTLSFFLQDWFFLTDEWSPSSFSG